MKRRSFITNGLTSASGLLIVGRLPIGADGSGHVFAHESMERSAVIRVNGLARPVTMLQISDTHISYESAVDVPYSQYSARMRDAFPTVKHHATGAEVLPMEGFKALVELAKEEHVDLIALTGDILNYPSATAVNAVMAVLDESGVPFVYTPGNHDWHYEGMEGSADELRKEWVASRLTPFFRGGNSMCSNVVIGGVNFVTIDNSTYQINRQQLDFFNEQQRLSYPIALLVHIPLFMPGLSPSSCGHPAWGSEVDKGYKVERRQRWPEEGNDPSTEEFVEQVMAAGNLSGIFAGHWHTSRVVVWKNKVQYIAEAAFKGGYRLVKFMPLE